MLFKKYPDLHVVQTLFVSHDWQLVTLQATQVLSNSIVYPELQASHLPGPAVVHNLQFGAQGAQAPEPSFFGARVVELHFVH